MKKKTTIIYLISIGIALLFLIYYTFISEKDYYKIQSRVKNIETTNKIGEDYDNVAWLRIQGTNIDFPVVKEKNGAYKYPVDKDKYVWLINASNQYKDFIIINGHNIMNLSSNPKIKEKGFTRLEALMAFVYYDFAKENQYIQYTVNQKDYLYKIFSVAFIDNSSINAFINPTDEYTKEDIKEQIKLYKEKSLYNYDIKVNEKDKIITILTCTRFKKNQNVNFVVSGRLLRKKEQIKKTKIHKNTKNYKLVEDAMKGDKE